MISLISAVCNKIGEKLKVFLTTVVSAENASKFVPLDLKLTTERRTRVNWSRSINFRGLASHVGG